MHFNCSSLSQFPINLLAIALVTKAAAIIYHGIIDASQLFY